MAPRVRFARRRRAPVRRRRVSSRPIRYRLSSYRRFGMSPMKKFFAETFASNALISNTAGAGTTPGQVWTANITSIAQYANYKALYKKYRIVKLVWTYIPDFGVSDPNNAELVASTSAMWDTNIRMHFVKDYSGDPTPTPSEIDLIDHQGSKTIMLNTRSKPVKVAVKYPVTLDSFLANQGGGLTTTVNTTKNRWCDFDDSVQPEHGSVLTHTVSRSLGAFAGTGQPIGSVYCKVVFECKDPR